MMRTTILLLAPWLQLTVIKKYLIKYAKSPSN
jgi:hypothetical protein